MFLARILAIQIITLLIINLAEADLEPTFARCCALGANWARENQNCLKFPAPVPGEPTEHQSICLTAASICCLRYYRESQCETAKQAAKTGSECSTSSEPGGEFFKDCCDGCKLGLISGSMAMECAFQGFSFGFPWNDAYLECCIQASPPGTVDREILTPKFPGNDLHNTNGIFPDLDIDDENFIFANRVDGDLSIPDSENLCLLFPGQLCGHVCVPTPGSFICQCRAGFTLSVDGKTCIQDHIKDRCELNNPCDHVCRDTGVSIECSCNLGYQLALDQRTCKDIDECLTETHQCLPSEQACYNQPGSYSCINSDGSLSTPGLSWGTDPRITPENPTQTFGGSDRRPINRIGAQGYSGTVDETKGICPPGYKFNLETRLCNDVDECAVALGICGQGFSCQNSIGSYSCTPLITGDCPNGFTFNINHQSCLDVNECILGTHNCGPSELCLNTQGDFECQVRESSSDCPAGYKYNSHIKICEDVNECLEGLHSCHPTEEICRNIIGAYECDMKCEDGFQFTTDPPSCVDLNECLVNLHACDLVTEVCVNTVGSYLCESITENESRVVTPLSVLPLPKVTLATPVVQECLSGFGFDLNTSKCLDINECVSGLHNCTTSTHRCINTLGGFICTPKKGCLPGYTISSTSGECIDVDECSQGFPNCLPGQICVNTEGSFECRVECRDGFIYEPQDPAICVDVNECVNNPCGQNEHCINTEGSFTCLGRSSSSDQNPFTGYLPEGDNSLPLPTPPTTTTTSSTTTTPRPRTTTKAPCPRGYRRTRNSECKDVNECAEGLDQCLKTTEACVNLPGTYTCRPKPCSRGFYRDSNSIDCKDIDECSNEPCRLNEECINTPGSFICREKPSCSDGFRRNPSTEECEDINECLEEAPCDIKSRCINTRGSYRCTSLECSAGYQVDERTGQCEDVDECETGEHNCQAPTEHCVNSPGTYRCKSIPPCPPGLTGDPKTLRCVDIDECAEGLSDCVSGERCFNLYGRYKCFASPSLCLGGFKYHSASKRCKDVDECSEGIDNCTALQTCINSVGTFRCIDKEPDCDFGYLFDEETQECLDIDECDEGLHLCSRSREKCFNLPGAYRCDRIETPRIPPTATTTTTTTATTTTTTPPPSTTLRERRPTTVNVESEDSPPCPYGYRYDEYHRKCKDVDECLQSPCSDHELCVNTIGGFNCDCKDGFARDNLSGECKDVNECQLGLHTCERLQRCDNTLGSYTCTRISGCGTGYTLNHNTGKCDDINECIEGESPCRRNERCFNYIGSYECRPKINCGRGYEMNEYGTQCIDIDECEAGTHTCSGGQLCINRPGGYVCQCQQGYRLNINRQCEDINECQTAYSKLCGNTGECENTPGSYQCICKQGFKKSQRGESCVDIDECSEVEDVCEHNCINVWGSHYCTCNAGYKLSNDNRTCSDVNECEEIRGRGRLCLGICLNTPGTFKCSCPEGYKLEEDQRTCKDINECDNVGTCRNPDDICVNTRGSYRCQTIACPPNYSRDPNHRNSGRSGLYCRKNCTSGDRECHFNSTQAIIYHFVALPSMPIVSRPMPLTALHITSSGPWKPSYSVIFDITDGNEKSCFDVRRSSRSGWLRLVRPVNGPERFLLRLFLDVIDHFRSRKLRSRTVAFVDVDVAEFLF